MVMSVSSNELIWPAMAVMLPLNVIVSPEMEKSGWNVDSAGVAVKLVGAG